LLLPQKMPTDCGDFACRRPEVCVHIENVRRRVSAAIRILGVA